MTSRSRLGGAAVLVALLLVSSIPLEPARAASSAGGATGTLADVRQRAADPARDPRQPDAWGPGSDDRRPPAAGAAPELGKRLARVRHGAEAVDTLVFDREVVADGREARAGSLLVKFRGNVASGGRDGAHRAGGAAVVEALRLPNLVRVQVQPGRIDAAIALYRTRPDVEYVEPDYIVRAGFTTNDPSFGSQWGMTKIAVPQAWDKTRSDPSVKIAILDCGMYSASSSRGPGHVDLRDKIVLERDFSGSSTGADDWCDHGTHVAGIAAATTNNGTGVAGVGFDATILNGKVLGDDGSGTVATVAQGITWAADNGARVVNLSLGSDFSCGSTYQAAVDYAWARSVVVVAAAGNSGYGQSGRPGNCANVISVGATDQSDGRPNFSNYGTNVDVAAPGVGIYSTRRDGGYTSYSGTSMAAPHVAGLAALVWATEFGTSNQSVVDRIQGTADRVSGTGSLWTYGRINALSAVGTVPPTATATPEPTSTPTPVPTFTPTPVPTNPPAVCPNPSQRPPVGVVVTPVNDATLSVRVTAGQGYIRALEFGDATNAWIDVANQTNLSGNASPPLPAFQTTTTFTVRRVGAGAVTVPVTVRDDCGAWPTLVGRGT